MPTRFQPDAELILKLATIIDETGLTEIEYAEGDRRIRVARSVAVAAAPAIAAPPVTGAAPASSPASHAAAAPDNAVVSPMVGTVYLSAEPGAPTFVKPGDRVSEGQTLLIIEAMKVMNPIKSPRAGAVRTVLVKNAEPVEYGQPLIVID
jgi:acetyl-CoA carboxylase biotin carboxyl carrier protein